MKTLTSIGPITSVLLAGIAAFVMHSFWMKYEKHHAHGPEEFTGIQLESTAFPHLAAAHVSADLKTEDLSGELGKVEMVMEDEMVRLKAQSFRPYMIKAVEVSYGFDEENEKPKSTSRMELSELESDHDFFLPLRNESDCEGYKIKVELAEDFSNAQSDKTIFATGTANGGYSILRLCTLGEETSGGSTPLTAMVQ